MSSGVTFSTTERKTDRHRKTDRDTDRQTQHFSRCQEEVFSSTCVHASGYKGSSVHLSPQASSRRSDPPRREETRAAAAAAAARDELPLPAAPRARPQITSVRVRVCEGRTSSACWSAVCNRLQKPVLHVCCFKQLSTHTRTQSLHKHDRSCRS